VKDAASRSRADDNTPEEFTGMLKDEISRWNTIVQTAKVKPMD
jgi:hypothetical protein